VPAAQLLALCLEELIRIPVSITATGSGALIIWRAADESLFPVPVRFEQPDIIDKSL
jgi:hypothetical protein